MLEFTCNICSGACRSEIVDREIPSCVTCGSNVRFRWIVHALSTEVFGESLPLREFPESKALRGLGMTDSHPIAEGLSEHFSYRNTYFDQQPQFDIMAPPTGEEFDFVVASEVFEHVRPPVQTAFDNLFRMLSPGGFVVFSSPWESEGDTVEHFPNLHDWQLVQLQSGPVVVNRTAGGGLETYEDLNFHDGPGSTLEMRVFSKAGLLANFEAAGFARVSFAEDYPEFGIVWEWSQGLVLRKKER
jgi:SAM-dependent methyltransferase